ncbi:class I adenylate-forming enzyme family protein [uncultured Williamsia sp.]|uniref:class I adenylate-forming enzyme family protein n=1 Tax=uncultured Williamsia sp. TaxID=259311 RepID=UPI002628A646|nr:class I adenylate-forming enzyme family protein [uncultured Williamsia sp.]
MSTGLADRLATVLSLDPSAQAVEFEGRWSTWRDLHGIATAVAGHLRRAGLTDGARVGVVLRNHPAVVGAVLGVLSVGGCVVTVNPSHGDTGLAGDVADLGLGAVVARPTDWGRAGFREAAAGALGLAVSLPPGAVEVLGERDANSAVRTAPGVAVEMLTSGTTGPPKRIPLSYESFEHTVAAAGSHYGSGDAGTVRLRSGVTIVSSPMVHMSGMFRTLLNICEGRRVCLLERFRVDEFTEAVRRHRPKAVSLVPSALGMVLDADIDPGVFSSVQVVTSGTSHLPVETQVEFEKRYDVAVLPSYGATEFAGGVAGWNLALHREWAERKRGSVGRCQKGREIRIVDPDSGAERAAGEQGRVEVRTRGGEWVATTDLGRVDADGFVFIDGRIDDVIIRGGFKITPSEIVSVLQSHPAVRDAGVTSLPDHRLGAVPVAAVETVAGSAVTPEELTQYVRDRVSKYLVPTQIVVVDELPRTPSMKVSQPRLRELFSVGAQ